MALHSSKKSRTRLWPILWSHILSPNKIRNKLLLIVLILSAINFLFFSFYSVRSENSYFQWTAKQHIQNRAVDLARFIHSRYVNQLKIISDLIRPWPVETLQSSAGFQAAFLQLQSENTGILAMNLFDPQRHLIFSQGQPVMHSEEPMLCDQNPSSSGDIEFMGISYKVCIPHFFAEFKQLALPIVYELSSKDTPNSPHYLVLYFSLHSLLDAIEHWPAGSATEIALVNRNHELLFQTSLSPHAKLWLISQTQLPKLPASENLTSTYSTPEFVPALFSGDKNVLRASASCPSLHCNVFLEQDASLLAIRVSQRRLLIVALLLGPLLLTLALGLLFVYQVVRPLEELENGIKLFETGLLAEALPIRTQDEIGHLTQSFNQMVSTLVTRNEEIQRKTRNLAFVTEITGIINQSIDLNTFLDLGLRRILQVLQLATGWIYVFDPQLKKLSLISHHGVPELLVDKLKNLTFADILMQKTFTSGKPSLIRDISRHMLSPTPGLLDNIHDLLLVPLRSKKRIVGVMALASNQKYTLRYQDLDQLTRIGNELGVAVENALLYIELQLKIKEREEVNRDLQEMDRFKTRILSNVSHELRTPITSIKTYVELFLCDRIGSLTEDQKDKLRIVSRNINNLLNLINDLLTLARIQDNKMLIKNMEVIDLLGLVDTVISDTLEMAKAKGLNLSRTGITGPALVRANRQKIIQVLHNLISNAIKFTEHGSIQIDLQSINSTQHSGQNAEKLLKINVIDTGIGIPKKSIRKIFQRFYQVDSSSTRKYVGTGLGLAIVKEIVESHGSSIQVDSKLNQGSCFWFTLPQVDISITNSYPPNDLNADQSFKSS